jgi:hypothetical protein
MNWVSWRGVLGGGLLMAGLGAVPVRAEVRTGESIDVPAGQTVDGNFHAVGGTVTIGGDVVGDVVVAGGTVIISGHVRGDVLAAGSTVVVTGAVDGDVRAIGGDVSVSTTTTGDVMVAGGTVNVAGRVGGDALVAGSDATVRAPVGHSLYVAGAVTRLSGPVGRNVVAAGDHLVLADGCAITGDVDFTGHRYERSAAATVGGTIKHTPAETESRVLVRSGVVGWLQGLVGLAVFGALWLTLFRGFALRAMDTLASRPAVSFGVGCGVLFVSPMALGVVFAFGLIVGGWWMSLFGGAILAMAAALTFPLVAGLFGRRFLMGPLRAKSEMGPMLVALLAMSLLMLVPVLGAVLTCAIVVFGLGSITLTLVPTIKQARQPSPTLAPP